MRQALKDAQDEGCTTTTLQATEVGEHLYLNLGYRRLSSCSSGKGDRRASTPRSRTSASAPAAETRRRSRTRARSRARAAATAPSTTPSRSPARSRPTRTTRSSCSSAASSPTAAAGRCRAASWTSASPSKTPRSGRPGRRRTSRSRSSNLVGVYSRSTDRIVVVVYAARTEGTPSRTEEALEVHAFRPTTIPSDELAFWSDDARLARLFEPHGGGPPPQAPPDRSPRRGGRRGDAREPRSAPTPRSDTYDEEQAALASAGSSCRPTPARMAPSTSTCRSSTGGSGSMM